MTEDLNIKIEIPFTSEREADIVYQSLRVDIEPRRKQIQKKLSVEGNKLIAEIMAPDARSLRVGVNSFMDMVILSTETIHKFGPPLSESYSH
ncbi:uncharacterized protein LOC128992597 [Macrosteles quadrilineatus]|uniref:uncharacterized protein LOC128992597 n=1 Tax=Macrosteles quadrilineatus TaxID=74068 RepID=UPI0023E202D9|nr:uncharacterized protein LOC128992597 [Macrosteles quadrilineatus]